jgi:hypothetical protein
MAERQATRAGLPQPKEQRVRATTGEDAAAIAAASFVSEVEQFRAAITDPSVEFAVKQRAWDTIVRHATLLDPQDAGFWRAGVALKDAVCAWLEANLPAAAH